VLGSIARMVQVPPYARSLDTKRIHSTRIERDHRRSGRISPVRIRTKHYDGNHHYEYVKSDIENYYPLLTEWGIIAGDDVNWIGVAQAVTEFAIENEVQPHFEKADSDWFFIKGRAIDTADPLPHSVESNAVTKEKHSI
jgi:hypothetical protein